MRIPLSLYEEIVSSIDPEGNEKGCLLGQKDGSIVAIKLDREKGNEGSYSPDVDYFNLVLTEWAKKGISFGGILHSHPNGLGLLSDGDISYILRLGSLFEGKTYFPLLVSENGKREIVSYRYEDGKIGPDELDII